MTNNRETHEIPNKNHDITEAFSSNTDEAIDDFQTAHMIQKIKKIRKKKQKRIITGMEEFEVLTNTPTLHPNQTDTTSQPPSSHSSTIFSVQYWKEKFFGKTIEGVQNKYFTDDEYDGRDNIKEPANKTSQFKKTVVNGINTIYDSMNSINNGLAKGIVNAISKGTATDDDIKLVRNQIALIESAIVSSWMVYNWYFLMFYAKVKGTPIREISRDNLFEWAEKSEWLLAFLYIFEFAIWFPEKLDYFLLHQVPSILSWFLNGTCQFVIIYLLCLLWTKNFAIAFKNFFIDLLTDATGNMLINLMFAIVFILFFVSMFTIKLKGEIGNDTKQIISAIGSYLSPVASFFKWFLRFLITMVVSVPMGAVICGLYLIIYSLFGRYIYGSKTDGIVYQSEIDEYLRSAKAGFQEEDMCNNGGFMSFIFSILQFIFDIMEYVKEHILKLVFFIIFLDSSVSMTKQLSLGMTNRSILIFFNILISIAFAVMIWVSFVETTTTKTAPVMQNVVNASGNSGTNANVLDDIKKTIIENTNAQTEMFVKTSIDPTIASQTM